MGSCWEVYVVHRSPFYKLPVSEKAYCIYHTFLWNTIPKTINTIFEFFVPCSILFQFILVALLVKFLIPRSSMSSMRLNVMQVCIFEVFKHWREIHVERNPGNKPREFYTLAYLNIHISCSNLLGLSSHAYSIYAFVSMTVATSIIIWSYVVFHTLMIERVFTGKTVYILEAFFINITPAGVHPLMCIILVPIEAIGYFIRPLSLALRLSCNMIAGHIIISMLGAGHLLLAHFVVKYKIFIAANPITACYQYHHFWINGGICSSFIKVLVAPFIVVTKYLLAFFCLKVFIPLILAVLTGFEIFVAIVQGYIYCRLVSQFLSEVGQLH